MAVGYRSFLSVEQDEPVVDTVRAVVRRWARNKGIDTPSDMPGWYLRDGNDAITVLDERVGETRLYRWRRHHPYAAGSREMSRTTVTAAQPATGEGWLWTEIELPRDSDYDTLGGATMMAVPGFLRELLGELPCLDGRTPVSADPQWIAPNHLPDLMDYLADESRRGAVYVLSQGERDSDEFVTWASDITWELAGLGTAFLLNDVVEPEFNDMVGPKLAVTTGRVRTYQPGVDLDDPRDPKRHQLLSADRIERHAPRALTHMLGLPQRERAIRIDLPSQVQRANVMLVERERQERERVTGSRGKSPPPPRDLSDDDRAENAVLGGQVELLGHVVAMYRRSESEVRAALRELDDQFGDREYRSEREPSSEGHRIGVS
jgi:hypothetical protein